MYKHIDALLVPNSGLVGVYNTEEDFLAGLPPLRTFRIYTNPTSDVNLTNALKLELINMGDAEPAPEVPVVVSRFQARAALYKMGLLGVVSDAIRTAGVMAQLAWEDVQEFRRDSPTVAALAASLHLTDTQVDDLFILAGSLKV